MILMLKLMAVSATVLVQFYQHMLPLVVMLLSCVLNFCFVNFASCLSEKLDNLMNS